MNDPEVPTRPPDEIAEAIFDASLEIERIIHLDFQTVGDSLDSDLTDFLTESSEVIAELLGVEHDALVAEVDEVDWSEALNCGRRGPFGWLLEVTVPTYEAIASDPTRSAKVIGWNRHCTTVGAKTYEAAVEKALLWAEAQKLSDWPEHAAVSA